MYFLLVCVKFITRFLAYQQIPNLFVRFHFVDQSIRKQQPNDLLHLEAEQFCFTWSVTYHSFLIKKVGLKWQVYGICNTWQGLRKHIKIKYWRMYYCKLFPSQHICQHQSRWIQLKQIKFNQARSWLFAAICM